MFKWLKKIFMSDNNTEVQNNADVSAKTDNQTTQEPIIEREFEIAVYDISIDDNTGKETMKPVAFSQPVIIKATSLADLKSKLGMYKATGQFAKVVREIGQTAIQQPIVKQPVQQIQNNITTHQPIQINPVVQEKQNIKTKPRFFKVGDIEVKDDNGKIYQKQWVKLTDSESSNIRIINNKNNSIVNLTGKSIEMKKWILVEQTDDELNNLEENL